MACSRSAIALVTALLVLPATAGPPAAAGPRAGGGAAAGPHAAPPTAPPTGTPTGTPGQPCPAPSPPVARPPRPSPPPAEPARRAVGGAALATAGLAVPPGSPAPPRLTATSWVVADLTSGAVLGGCGPHEYGVPASVQKLLVAAAFMPDLDPARVIQVTRSDLDFEPGSSAMGLLLDGRYSIETLWLGLLLNSGNDAANVLARLGGGTAGLAGGLAEMNAEARRLGAYQTHAATPSGLDGPGQFTSAYDLALIARACFARADFRRYVATQRAEVPGQPPDNPRGFAMLNDNQLLVQYPGALGGKTGYTDLARHSFVGAAERNGRRLVVTLLGAEAQPLRGWQQGAALLDWGFGLRPDASVGRLVDRAETPSPAVSPFAAAAANGTAGASANRRTGGASPLVLAAGSAAVFAVLLLLLGLVRRRRRARRVAVPPV